VLLTTENTGDLEILVLDG